MSPSPLRVALLGCGRVARLFHLPILARRPDVELVAVADPDPTAPAAARSVAPRATTLTDWRAALEHGDVDAVVIALSTDLHAEAARAAFERGLHVYLEKPIAARLADGRLVAEAWRASGRVGATGFNGRFDPTVLALKRAVGDGRVGRLVGARIAIGGGGGEPPPWKRSRETGGGALLDLGSHAVDLARFVFDREIVSVTAALASLLTEEDTATLSLSLGGGGLVQAFVSLAGVQESTMEVVGDRGVLVADRYARAVVLRPPRPPYGRLAHLRRGLRRAAGLARSARDVIAPPEGGTSYAAALHDFVRAARGAPLAGADIEDGLRALEVVIAAEEAARAGGAAVAP